MSRRRWYERNGYSIEREASLFTREGLAFSLDEEAFAADGSVVFRGELRLGERRTPAAVYYPAAYDQGAQPQVAAPDLEIGRHRGPGGLLCLDHPVLGYLAPMTGSEAIHRAERLWDLWKNHPEQLRDEEAEAADPYANQVEYEPESALFMVDLSVAGGKQGVLRFGLTELRPSRGALTGARVDEPDRGELEVCDGNRILAGPYQIFGLWQRLKQPPPATEVEELRPWFEANHSALMNSAVRLAQVDRQVRRRADIPALIGFVYPDEGPGRDEYHDAWLLLLIDPSGEVRLPRPALLRSEERWLRQPKMRELEQRRVGVVGSGALGSPTGTWLARAGVGDFVLVDHDIVTVGNRVRHELDLTDVGRAKVRGLAARIKRINPEANITMHQGRFGATSQAEDDAIFESLAGCDLIVNATANVAAGYHVAAAGREAGRPVLHTWVGAGAWGGRVLLQTSGSGCPLCLAHHQEDGDLQIPELPEDPALEEVAERGCANVTFTGPGFELSATAAAATRAAVGLLLADSAAYPLPAGDVLTLRFRGPHTATPEIALTRLPIHPDCSICNRDDA